MVCDKSFWRANVQTIYFSGVLVGSFVLGILSDRFGRRPIMLFSFILFIAGGFGIAFGAQKAMGVVGGYVFYAICRFMVAVATRGINVTGYILGLVILFFLFTLLLILNCFKALNLLVRIDVLLLVLYFSIFFRLVN
jgi:MFS family permease